MNFSFVIPNSNSDLLSSGSGDLYYVKQVYNPREIPDQLKICKRQFVHGDAFFIFDHFDTFFSVIENSTAISAVSLTASFDILYLTIDKLMQQVSSQLTNQSEHGWNMENDRNSYLNLTKMTVYLMTSTVKAIDNLIHQAQSEAGVSKKKGSKRTAFEDFEMPNWDDKRFRCLVQIYNLMQLPLERLWNPPICEQNFVNMICDLIYRILENLRSAREKHVNDTIFQILGTAIKRYNHAMNFPVRILQILRSSETALAPIARGIQVLHDEFNLTSVFSVLMQDISESLCQEVADTQISRFFSTFLSELSTIAPKILIPHLFELSEDLLNCESHVLRSCVLQIMGEVLSTELTSEDLDEEKKKIRNQFLDNLCDHMHDVSAHVRSKVLQILYHLKEERAIPLADLNNIFKRAVGRLEDRTATVRKNAIALIRSFLETNPYTPTLTLDQLIVEYTKENDSMEKTRDRLLEARGKLEKQWDQYEEEISPMIAELLEQESNFECIEGDFENMVPKITNLLFDKKFKEAITLAIQADAVAGNADERRSLKFEEQCTYFSVLLRSYLEIQSGYEHLTEKLKTQVNRVQFMEDAIEFSKTITKAVPKITDMLMSKVNSDVFEAVEFFTCGYRFRVKGTEGGMCRMLYLVWSGDKEKRDAVTSAYKKVLFTTDYTGRAHAHQVVKNLSEFLQDITHGHFSALEVLIKEWVINNDIDSNIIQLLFEIFTMKIEGTTPNQSRLALELLIAASAARSSIATANISVIESIGLGDRGLKDPRIYCGCLRFLLNSIPENAQSKFYKRYESTDSIVEKVIEYFLTFFFHPRLEDFDGVASRTFEFFYHLCQAPDIICQKLISEIVERLKKFLRKCENLQVQLSQQPIQSQLAGSQQTQTQNPRLIETPQVPTSQTTEQQKLQVPAFLVSRFLFSVGFATMKEMIFLDMDVYNNMKMRQELKEAKDKKNLIINRKANVNTSASSSLKRLSEVASEPQQEPEDLVGATAEDSIAELINHICEEVLLFSVNGMLHKIVPIVIEVLKYPSKFKDNVLQQTACLTLVRFMSVSSKFCDKHMPFLMNILQLTKNLKIKCIIVIGLSDLTFRFPNVIEPWTSQFYGILHEENDELRLTAVKMISHLISHEMIRVKGQISDLAMCIVDKNEEIRNITQQFFKEIANKSNILYNVLPDIISKLTDPVLLLEEEKYHIIMRYILGLIQKDRQVESLVDKLCLRFTVSNEERQWRDIAFSLSLLNYTEKTIKKLIDNIHLFKDKVQVDDVYQSFKTIISNTSKLAKPELKTVITEFESRLNECLNVNDEPVGAENEGKNNQAASSQHSSQRGKKPRGNPPRRKTRGKYCDSETGESSSEDDSEDERVREPIKKQNVRLPKRAVRKKGSHYVQTETSSEEDVAQSKKGKKT